MEYLLSAETIDSRSNKYPSNRHLSFQRGSNPQPPALPDFLQKPVRFFTWILILIHRILQHFIMSNDIITYHHSTTIQLLYQLSYRSIFSCEWIARIELAPFVWKTNILTVIRYPQVSERSACFLPLYIIIKEKHLLLSARFQRNRTSCDSRMHSAEQNQDLQSKSYIYACIDGTSRP